MEGTKQHKQEFAAALKVQCLVQISSKEVQESQNPVQISSIIDKSEPLNQL
jgi:hypothetical protein